VSHTELFFAVVSLVTVSIAAPMLIAWWNTRLRMHERQLERARRDGIATANEVYADLLKRAEWIAGRLEQYDLDHEDALMAVKEAPYEG
jgi:hypothetical protein